MSGSGSDSIDKARLASINSLTDIGKAQIGLANKADARLQKSYDSTFPYFKGRMDHGLPYMDALTDQQGGLTHQAFAPARGAMERRLSNLGDLPSGFGEQSRADLDAQEARAFDQNLLGALQSNDQAKFMGAEALSGQMPQFNPGQNFNGAASAFGNAGQISPTQPQPNPAQGAIGGLVSGLSTFF